MDVTLTMLEQAAVDNGVSLTLFGILGTALVIQMFKGQIKESIMSRRRRLYKRRAEWGVIAEEVALTLHRLQRENKVGPWASGLFVKKMFRHLGMDVSAEPTFGKPWYKPQMPDIKGLADRLKKKWGGVVVPIAAMIGRKQAQEVSAPKLKEMFPKRKKAA